MKTRLSLFIICLLFLTTHGFAEARNIEGNGKIVTKEISIKDYDAVYALGVCDVEYEQSTASPYLQITVDENILPYLDIHVKGKTLTIEYKDLPEGITTSRNGSTFNYGCSLEPTKFIIKSNSTELKGVDMIGGGHFTANSPLKTYKMEASLAGGGSIDFSKPIEVHKGKFDIAGSGNIYLRQATLVNIDCSVAGGGDIQVKGSADRGNLNVAGGGDIHAYNCDLKKAECNVAGGGSIEVYASENLDANIAAGGKIRYKGDPEVSKSTIAGGSIKKYND